MNLFTIGTNKKTAKNFFMILKNNNVKGIIDIRLNNNSQLNGFSKGKDLEFFLKEAFDLDYIHMPNLAPTKDILKRYREKQIDWKGYEKEFIKLMEDRKVEESINLNEFSNYCLLCSEETAEKCHRRLVGNYLKSSKDKLIHL